MFYWEESASPGPLKNRDECLSNDSQIAFVCEIRRTARQWTISATFSSRNWGIFLINISDANDALFQEGNSLWIVLATPWQEQERSQGGVRALPLFYKFSLYFSLLLFSLSLLLLFFIFIIYFPPYLVPSRLALLTPGFPILHYSSLSSSRINLSFPYSLHLVDPSATGERMEIPSPETEKML